MGVISPEELANQIFLISVSLLEAINPDLSIYPVLIRHPGCGMPAVWLQSL
jgi:hypothetical protein